MSLTNVDFTSTVFYARGLNLQIVNLNMKDDLFAIRGFLDKISYFSHYFIHKLCFEYCTSIRTEISVNMTHGIKYTKLKRLILFDSLTLFSMEMLF